MTGYTIRTPKTGLAALTPTELEIIKLIAEGMHMNEIADMRCRSRKTISTHKFRIMAKIDVRNDAQLGIFAFRNGLVA